MIEHASADSRFCVHPGFTRLGVETYVAVPLRRLGGEVIGTLCALDSRPTSVDVDVLELFTLCAELIARQLDEDEFRHERERFLAAVGHDLRSPIHAINLAAHLLRAGDGSDEEDDECLRRIEASVARLISMADDMADFTRGRMGAGTAISPRSFDVGDLVRGVIDEASSASAHRVDLDVDLDIESGASGRVTWDEFRMQQALSSLLTHALSHADPGVPVRVTVSGDDESVQLSVWNAGSPMSEEEIAAIFEPSRRGVDGRGGRLGLGLSIAREVVRVHGGELEVESTREHGTTFTVGVPRHAQPEG